MKVSKSVVRAGFTLVELAVVIVFIGMLAAFAVPRFRTSVERSKAVEAFNYLSAVQVAQERYHASQGIYASTLTDLDVQFTAPKYFSVGEVEGDNLKTSWGLTLTRTGNAAGYGAYTVIFTQDGFDAKNSTITQRENINPLRT